MGARHPFQLVAVIAVIGALIALYHRVHADHHRDGVSGIGCGGAAGVLVEQGAAAVNGCESAIDWASVEGTLGVSDSESFRRHDEQRCIELESSGRRRWRGKS